MKASRPKRSERQRYHAAGLAIAIMEANALRVCFIVQAKKGHAFKNREMVPIQPAQ